MGQRLSLQEDESATGWSWESEEPTSKSASMEIPASGHSCFTRCQKTSKGGRRESVIGCFCNPFLQEAQQPIGPEQAAAHPLLGGLGEPRPPRRAPGHGVPQLLPLSRAGRSHSGGPGVAKGAGELLGPSHSCCWVYRHSVPGMSSAETNLKITLLAVIGQWPGCGCDLARLSLHPPLATTCSQSRSGLDPRSWQCCWVRNP